MQNYILNQFVFYFIGIILCSHGLKIEITYANPSINATQQNQQKSKSKGFIQKQLDQVLGTQASAHESGTLLFPTLSYAPETQWNFGLNGVIRKLCHFETMRTIKRNHPIEACIKQS